MWMPGNRMPWENPRMGIRGTRRKGRCKQRCMDEARRNICKFNSIRSVHCEYNHIQYRQWQVGEFYSGIRMRTSPCQYCAHFYICNSLFVFHIARVNWMCYFCGPLCECCLEDGDWSPKHVGHCMCAVIFWFYVNCLHLLVCVINPLKPELNPICYLLALLAHHFLHVSRIRVKLLTFRRLMSYIYGAPILDVSRSHTTTQHSR